MTRDQLIESCFGEKLPPPDLSLLFEINDDVLSHVGIFWRTVTVDGRAVRVAGIGSVCTALGWRRRCLATTLIEAANHVALSHGVTVAALWSSQMAFYERLGYMRAGVPNFMWCPILGTANGGDTLAGDIIEAEADW